MRIIGGAFGGRRIDAPAGLITRPTSDRTREAIFNILSSRYALDFTGKRILDLFAGSGALGLEALSRGAAWCLFVETNADVRGVIRDNIEKLGLFGATRVHRRSASALGMKPAGVGQPFDLTFLDPPYEQGFVGPTLRALYNGAWLNNDALIVVEQSISEASIEPEYLAIDHAREYSGTRILFYRQRV